MALSWTSLLCIGLAALLGNFYTPMCAEASKILVALPFSATSHNNVISALTKELAARGHTLKVITPFPISNPPKNYTQIDVSKIILPLFKSPKAIDESTFLQTCMLISKISDDICKGTLAMPEIKELIKSAESGEVYDLVIVSMFYNDCFYGLAHIFNAPLVLVSPAGSFPITDTLLGNPSLPSFVPNLFSPYSDRMTFIERAHNSLLNVLSVGFHYFMIYPRHNAIMKESLGESIPSINEIEKRVSLVLLNTHHSLLYPRPLLPNLVEVGGMHIKPPKSLPPDIKKFMDDAKDGVIYFSLGSNLKSTELPEEQRNALFSAFGELKQKVMLKWETDKLPGQAPNVKLSKWWPQSDILAHPNVKIFITHGGLLSFEEAVERGVPLIGIPFYGDQDLNMKRVANMGVGLQLDFKSMTKESVLKAINTILNDHSFSKNMKQLSAVWKDRQETPLEKAVYWTEYILRHEGAPHLKSGALELAWCQYYLLDIAAVIGFAILVVFSIFALIMYFMFRLCCKKSKTNKKGSKDSKKQKKN